MATTFDPGIEETVQYTRAAGMTLAAQSGSIADGSASDRKVRSSGGNYETLLLAAATSLFAILQIR